ncbi:transglycosylase domain-containing protein [Salinispora oceanensis]|uniref:transglycosylase domain-containing protein n=1 Tax=Salinispora oceanensis TaxID=1050199 RepID=UPI0003A2BCF4|nr:transglycosylase domain-containing protein [Salinispora oceanensis]
MLIASFAVFIMLAGLGVVGFTYFSTNVVLPDQIPLPQSTTVYTRDGKGLVAKLGNENRTLVTISQMPQHVRDAVAAAEDRNFYRHSGVDYKGIVRAAWNNLTGGGRQGASTITQQYARNAYESLEDDTYARKVREAIFASKLNDEFSKDKIMENYLNVIYFGRGAYGVEAAAQTFFGKPASELTVGEGAVLAGLIKQPEKTATHNGYDPATSPDDATARWDYVLDGMVAEGWLDAAERPTEFPEVKPMAEGGNGFGTATPRGNVINYVRAEMEQWGLCTNTGAEGRPSCSDELRTGGYRITTTIDDKMQTAMENAARAEAEGSPLNGEPDNLQAAGVAVDPKTGRVLAYYGGESGANIDYAGKNTLEGVLTGGHPPASSFKVYTLAAAIEAGISVNSVWDATPFTPEGYDNRIYNAGRDVSKTCGKSCTLDYSTVKSYNVPFFHVAEQIGEDKVVSMARQAGITTMWTDNPVKPYNLLAEKPEDLAPSKFDRVVGYGQYPITVLDHANGLATLANDGVFHQAHFVLKVEQKDETTGEWKVVRGTGEKLDGQQRIRKEVTDEVTAVLKQIPKDYGSAPSGREVAGKTGTWELVNTDHNSNAWMVGYDDNLATAIWIGSKDTENRAILDKSKEDIGGSGLPSDVWKKFMSEALKDAPKSDLPSITGVGDDKAGNGELPEPPEPDCGPFGLFCSDNDNNDNDDNDNGGDNNNGGGNGGDIGFPPPPNGGTDRPGRD